MNCPNCNKRSQVINSVNDGEVTLRIYKCPECGRKFVTSEMIDSDNLKSDIYRIRKHNQIHKSRR